MTFRPWLQKQWTSKYWNKFHSWQLLLPLLTMWATSIRHSRIGYFCVFVKLIFRFMKTKTELLYRTTSVNSHETHCQLLDVMCCHACLQIPHKLARRSTCFVAYWLWQSDARGATYSPTLSVAVRSPCRCSDYFQCPEVWSRDATTPGTPLASCSRTDYFQVGVPRLPVS